MRDASLICALSPGLRLGLSIKHCVLLSGWVIGTDRWKSEPPCVREGVAHGPTESGGIALASYARARAPRGGVARQGVVLTDFQSFLDCQ